jgi:hypothetical protein
MKSLALLCAVIFLVGCAAADVMISRRDTTATGRGTVEPVGNRLTATLGDKKCSGNFSNVADYSTVGLINMYRQHQNTTNLSVNTGITTAAGTASSSGTSSAVGTTTVSSTTGTARGMLMCSDGDVWRCEVRHDGPSGYGVCVGKDGAIYDIITGFFGR